MTAFKSASIILPVLNETYSLRQTVEIIEATCAREVGEYTIVVCERTKPASLAVCQGITQMLGDRGLLHFQKCPFVDGVIRDGFDLSRSSHVVMMSSDLETNPALARTGGESVSPFTANFAHFRIAITTRFCRRDRLRVHEQSAFRA
jgi:hypothetical protein